jgi:hypothetical protein
MPLKLGLNRESVNGQLHRWDMVIQVDAIFKKYVSVSLVLVWLLSEAGQLSAKTVYTDT